MFTRRSTLLGGAALLAGLASPGAGTAPARRTQGPRGDFVRRDGTAFRIGARRYHYAGTNMWYAPWLGADAPFGNRARLRRELDRLQALGVGNVRVNGSAEFSPLRNSVRPPLPPPSRGYDQTLPRGLHFAAARKGPRGGESGHL